MTDTLTPVVPPGWYDDPSDPAAFRWWSGAEWTTHTSPKQSAPSDPRPGYVPMSRDPRVNGLGAENVSAEIAQTPHGSPQTPGIWLLSFLPFMTLGLSAISTVLVVASGIPALAYVGVPFAIGLGWLFAVLDVRALRRRGYRTSSLLWMLLLPPLAYLIARGRSVRKQGGRAWPSELAYLGAVAIVGATALTLSALSVWSAQNAPAQVGDNYFYAGTFGESGTPTQPDVEGMLSSALAPDGSIPVDCSEGIVSLGSEFVCIADDTVTRTQVELWVNLCDCGDVYFSVQPVSGGGTQYLTEPNGDHGTGNGEVVAQASSAGSIPDESRPWQPQIEQSLSDWGGYDLVDCSVSAALIDKQSTFDCFAAVGDTPFSLNVTITEVGNIGYTEYAFDDNGVPIGSQSA